MSAGAAERADGGRHEVDVAMRSVDHPDAVMLLRAFRHEQVKRYGFADSVDVIVDDFTHPNGVFAVVYMGSEPVGCGGYRWFDHAAGTIEMKKVYLCPRWRGMGIGRDLLGWLEDRAVHAGARRLVLETGVRNDAAMRLFDRAGYRPAAPYVPGRDPAINRAFVKNLYDPGSPAHGAALRSIV